MVADVCSPSLVAFQAAFAEKHGPDWVRVVKSAIEAKRRQLVDAASAFKLAVETTVSDSL